LTVDIEDGSCGDVGGVVFEDGDEDGDEDGGVVDEDGGEDQQLKL